jgi:hypothetical protein
MRRLLVVLTVALVGAAMVAGPAGAGDDKPKNTKKAKAAIKDAYACFLSAELGNTIDEKLECVAEVGDDPEFLATAIELSEANAGAAEMTEPDVGKITFKSKKSAEVAFDLLIGGEPIITDQTGGAVLVKDDGKKVWKVSALTLCNLFALANPALLTEGPCADIIATAEV